ncbi:MAG: UTP--glucose-1-phosphate uridylyltransferase GalU [Desulfovibrio sp.]|nr:UTP--glucose-1-phosphate uridylyltransferase GalU [Desulfovibrio sp.]MBO4684728.1 UTP--glucose-1-phosphate uridylyltransferase GalU [Desulfovibrio sp.]MBR4746127.1 UTP--glucose-1-phosphate uridylyltransferase GalU [Desulfovibrio sp.]MBR6468440.1 UTP--glucose-1-phosphate uridylyltransferase GalU [Desulfovibrio sp.]
MKPIRKVVIPVAGWGTRSLPATKNIPKEMLPIYNKPVIQHVLEEAQAAGITDVIFITNRDKSVIEDYFDHNLQLEGILERAGKKELLKTIRDVAEMVNVIAVRQKEQKGLGHAIACARRVVGDEPFAVMVGDDVIFSGDPGIRQLMGVAQAKQTSAVGVMEVPLENVHRYGIVDGEETAPGIYNVKGLVEKPSKEKAPSRLAIVGRYILTPEIFDCLDRTPPGANGEIQLTDAMAILCKEQGMSAVKLQGKRFDAGNWPEFLSANIYVGMQDENIRLQLLQELRQFLNLY